MPIVPLTPDLLRQIAGPKAQPWITEGVVDHLPLLKRVGLMQPHRLAHFIPQIAHESDRFKTTREYASGAAYEGRKDLGNTQPGDGRRFRGHGLIQCTGRYNHTKFDAWVHRNFPDLNPPDFVKNPSRLEDFPWAMISAVWYWEVGNPTGKSLSRYADRNDPEMITRRINGGLNGYEDRLTLYDRTALALLGYRLEYRAIAKFQEANGLVVDDISGPATRGAMHRALVAAVGNEPVPQPAPPPDPIFSDDEVGQGGPPALKPDDPGTTPKQDKKGFWARLWAFLLAGVRR